MSVVCFDGLRQHRRNFLSAAEAHLLGTAEGFQRHRHHGARLLQAAFTARDVPYNLTALPHGIIDVCSCHSGTAVTNWITVKITEPSTPIVLIVEDEMALRMRAVDIVEDAGFLPIETVCAEEAMRVLESRDDISLLFTDIQMPGAMDGLKLAHAVHARWPHIKIVIVSGQVAVAESDKPSDSRFFPKPLEMKQMILELQDMMRNSVLAVLPNVDATDALLKENSELRRQLDEARSIASAIHLKTALNTEKQQLIIDGIQPVQDALTIENSDLRLALEQAGIDATALLVQSGIEADEREAADKLQNLIHAELHHRIKNILATVGAITQQSLRTATSMDHASLAIEGRLVALARAHDLLTQVSWENATIEETIRSAIRPYDQGTDRFVVSGADVGISSSSVIAFAMTLNELCTNTTKFGALSVPTGKVHISWTIEADRLNLHWVESGGPSVVQPTRKSFGTRMMSSLGHQLSGKVDLNYNIDGLIYTLDVPLAALARKPSANHTVTD